MNKKHLIIGLVIIIFSSYYAFRDVTVAELANAFVSVRYIYIIPTFVIIAMTFLFRAIRWRYLINPVKKTRTINLFSPLMVGFMGNMLPARAGEFVRAYLLGKKENISFSSSFATVFIERLFDMVMVLLMLFWVLLFRSEVFVSGDTGGNHQLMGYMIKFGWVSFTGCVFIFLFSALLQYKNDWAMTIVRLFTKPLSRKWKEKANGLVNSFSTGLNIIKDKSGFLAVVFFTLLIWITLVLTFYLLYLAFGIETGLPLISSLIILSLTIAIFITLFPTPGFLGSFQAACVVALHEIFEIPKAVAASYGIVAWLVTMGFVVAAGSFFVIKDNISFSEFTARKGQIQ